MHPLYNLYIFEGGREHKINHVPMKRAFVDELLQLYSDYGYTEKDITIEEN